MGYVGESLADIAPEEPLLAAARRTTERSRALLYERVRQYTPIAKPPPGVEVEWVASRGRMPGTLRESWREDDLVELPGGHFATAVYTNDPVAPHVEYPTRPHIIRPRMPGGRLRWWDAAGMIRFALLVHHPGTQGTYMLARALMDLSIEWQRIGAEELAKWARETEAMI